MRVAVIPVKHTSERVKNKNFRPFYKNLSLLEIKILQLKKNNCFDRIIISSNSSKAMKIAKKYKCEFFLRKSKFSNNVTSWSDVITQVLNDIKLNDGDIISWCHVTSPLFFDYKKVLKKFIKNEDKYDSIVAVNKFKGFLLNHAYLPVNYSWGKWHQYSQNLSPYYAVNGALFILRLKTAIELNYLIGKKPNIFLCNDEVSVDIDNQFDFDLAKDIFQRKLSKNKNIL